MVRPQVLVLRKHINKTENFFITICFDWYEFNESGMGNPGGQGFLLKTMR